MSRELLLRRALWAVAGFNALGALLFAFPQLPPGRLAGLPAEVPGAYRAFVALFILLFGGAYAWLARSEHPDRPMVLFGAIGKTSAFVLVTLLWLTGAVRGAGVLFASGDLVFAAIFFWCARGGRAMASRRGGGHARAF